MATSTTLDFQQRKRQILNKRCPEAWFPIKTATNVLQKNYKHKNL
jgi:hypothetical protein